MRRTLGVLLGVVVGTEVLACAASDGRFGFASVPAERAAPVATIVAGATEWALMERHGGCVSLADAAERLPALRGVATPDRLVADLRRQGEKVVAKESQLGGMRVVEVTAPALGLAVIFVPRQFCR